MTRNTCSRHTLEDILGGPKAPIGRVYTGGYKSFMLGGEAAREMRKIFQTINDGSYYPIEQVDHSVLDDLAHFIAHKLCKRSTH